HEKYPPALKLKLYDGQFEGEYRPAHAQEAREQSPRDGMRGVSPRQVINALAQALVGAKVPCINPVDALKALRGSLAHHVGTESREEMEMLLAALADVRKEYDDWAIKTVSRAFVAAFDDAAQDILKKYLDMAEASLRNDRVRDPVTGEWVEPDEKFMRSLEDLIGVSATGRRSFREELMVRVASALRRGETFRYDSHPKLKQAIEARLFADLQGSIRTTVSGRIPDEDQRARLREVKARLIEREGFCEHCADAILQYVGYLLERR
ncbi:MAG: protein prkA, partial [Clostridia bacterium]|nr:protein prkA [Clostridia bacterium]